MFSGVLTEGAREEAWNTFCEKSDETVLYGISTIGGIRNYLTESFCFLKENIVLQE